MAGRAFIPVAAVLIVAGCAPRVDDRVRLFTEDGVQLFAKGEYREALENFEVALTLNPHDPALHFNVAECYDRLGDAARAEQYYRYALDRTPDNADARLALCALYYRTGRAPQANRMIEEELTAHPSSADALVLDGWRLRQEKNLPLAQGRLQQALDREPHNRRALTEMAYIYETMGMQERALVLYERILQREPNREDVAARLQQLQLAGVRRPLRD